jgi:hypothetical protein
MMRTFTVFPTPETETAPEAKPLPAGLESMAFDQLAAYARENGIDIGNVTTAKSALARISAHLGAGAGDA